VPGPRGSAPLPRGRHTPRRQHGFKPLSGPRAALPDSVARTPRLPVPRASRSPLVDRRLALADRRLTPRTDVPTEPPPRQHSLGPLPAASPRPPVARRRHTAPVSRRFPVVSVRRCRAAAGSPSSATAEPRAVGQCRRAIAPCATRRACHAGRVRGGPSRSHAGRARCAGRGRGPRQRCTRGPCPALCIWAKRGFGPVAPG
jgi:hypothetical protein